MPDKNDKSNIIKNVIKYTSPVGWLAVTATEKILTKTKITDEQSSTQQQEVKTAQERSIARRIDASDEVEIEEFYDTSGSGGISAGFSESLSAGVSGSGRKVTKRTYKFKGWHDGGSDSAQDYLGSDQQKKR